MPKPIAVKALADYQVWLRYDDGAEGAVDLSDLAGRGVFKAWGDPALFRAVRLGSHGAIEWDLNIDLLPSRLRILVSLRSGDCRDRCPLAATRSCDVDCSHE